MHVKLSDGTTRRMTGDVIDYNGQSLRLRRANGREEDIEAARVLQIETTWPEAATEADRLFAAGQAEEALPLYRKAVEEEQRRWARRELVSRLIRCYQHLGRIREAGQLFLALYSDDPQTPYFHAIPLAWHNAEPPGALAEQATAWQSDRSNPIAPLLGASWLLASSDRATATATLQGLAAGDDQRISLLAAAQLWRVDRAALEPLELERRQKMVARMPVPLQAGPQFVMGQTLAHAGKPDEAALAWMHLPLLYPQHRGLAAHGLLEAARQLEKTKHRAEAWALYREIVAEYADTDAAAMASRRLEEFTQ